MLYKAVSLLVVFCGFSQAFLSVSTSTPTTIQKTLSSTSSSTSLHSSTPGGGSESNIERIEFKIYPDGRVEEKVIGIKGENCQKVTEKINKVLGEVIQSEPTEEMFEQEVKLDQTLTNNNNNGGDSWEGASSW
jgi:hypothetical protein